MENIEDVWTGQLLGGSYIMRKQPDYQGREIEEWRKSAKRVSERLAAGESNLLKRIETYISRFGYPRNAVHDEINNNPMFAAHFAKEPRRTNFHEKLAKEWLARVKEIDELEKLPASGSNAFYVTGDGEVRRGMRRAPTKSLDFRWKTGRYTVYASHKYTKEGGGNQDSQFKEVRRLLELFQKGNVDSYTALLVIVDGPYYGSRRMSDLRRFCRSQQPPLSGALPIQEVPTWLKKHCLQKFGKKG